MKKLVTIIIILLTSTICFCQDSVRAKVIHTSENTLVFKVNKQRFISLDCKCDHLKRGDYFLIDKKRFDSLLKEAKPIKKNDF